ncbi:MAG: restriction endonuclease [Magnetococcales bacterium]|nr:restriction endonuclease [Magnetococcales bacterium]
MSIDNEGNKSTRSIYEIACESFDKARSGFVGGKKLNTLIVELKKLKDNVPADGASIKDKASWIKSLANTLADLKIFHLVSEQIQTQIPQIWSQLTLTQKLKLGAIAPIVGVSASLGGIGIVGGGSGIGVPVIIVTLLLLMITNSLVNFLDYVIRQLSGLLNMKDEPSQDAVAKVFEDILSSTINSIFGKEYGPESGKLLDNIEPGKENARSFELTAVSFLAEKYDGVGYVTRYSTDGGIDGYIIIEPRQEVMLVQAKHYQSKVGFPEATQYLGTFFYWKQQFESKFPYPISKMILVCSSDFSIEAKRVADAFSDVLILEKIIP